MDYEGRLPDEGINTSPEHPLRELAWLLGGFVALVVGCAVAAALLVDRLVPLLPPELEARLFTGWVGPDGDQEPDSRTAAVQALLDRMATHWAGHPYAFRASVLDDPEPNALALPGGWFAVTAGLLDEAGRENELALVLGHELGLPHTVEAVAGTSHSRCPGKLRSRAKTRSACRSRRSRRSSIRPPRMSRIHNPNRS